MNSEKPSDVATRGEDDFEYFPVSKQQQQNWMLQELYPNEPTLNLSAAFRIKGELNRNALAHAYLQVVHSHQILRTRFVTQRGELKQAVSAMPDSELIEEEIESNSSIETDGLISTRVRQLASTPFDLSQGAPLRAYLLRMADSDHVLLFVIHRTIADWFSLTRLLDELSIFYQNHSSGSFADADSEIRTSPYADYVEHQKAFVETEACVQDLAYWQNSVVTVDGFLDLPISRTRPTNLTFEGDELIVVLPASLAQRQRRLGEEVSTPLSTIFLCAFRSLLARYTRTTDFSVGITYENREHDGIKTVLGPTENVLPFCVNLALSTSFSEALRLTQKALLESEKHQQVSFDAVVEEINPPRDASYNPLYQVGFSYLEPLRLAFQGLSVVPIGSYNGTTSLDLCLQILDDGQEITARFEYNTRLFERSTLLAFAGHYQTLLESALESIQTPLALLQILTQEEARRQLVDWNDTDRPYPKRRTIHGFFEQQVAERPDNIAVVFEESSYTYKELDRRANRVANYLRTQGVGPDVLVGVCLERSCEMMVALLGVLKAGGGYIPMDPEYPKDRLAYIAENSRAPVLITQESLKSLLPESQAAVIRIDRDWDLIEQQSDTKSSAEAEPHHIAYVIYTSGSTGRPKGVQVPHGAVANLMDSMAREPGLTENDVLVSITTYSFDLSVPDLYLPLYVGARTVYVRREIAADGANLARILKETGATFMQATPSTWMLLLDSDWEGSSQLTALCGGEAWPQTLAERLVPRTKALWNMYGPTETTVWSTCNQIETPDSPVLIGKPVANTSVYILDENQQLVPVGVPGELHIGGHGVSRGYLARPKLTQEKFIANPFDIQKHPRIYKTGDSARFLSDGNLEYLNRLDNQVKIRGFRIELGEIESVLLHHEDVHQGVVVVREDTPGDKRLVGYYVLEQGAEVSEKELRDYLKAPLPSYMVPQHLVLMGELPKTPNGKIDRKALPKPQQLERENQAPYQDPTDLEKRPLDEWFYKPVWNRSELARDAELPQAALCLVFLDEVGVGESLVKRLREREYDVITVRSADSYLQQSELQYCINPEHGAEGYDQLVRDLLASGRLPNRIAHFWTVTGKESFRPGSSFFHRNQEHGFYSLFHLARAFATNGVSGPVQLIAVTNGAHHPETTKLVYPVKAAVLGPCMVMTRELPKFFSRCIDIDYSHSDYGGRLKELNPARKLALRRLVNALELELLSPLSNEVVAYSSGKRWVRTYDRTVLPARSMPKLRQQGIYLVTGGLGALGSEVCRYLVKRVQAKLVIVDQLNLPEKEQWQRYLADNHSDEVIRKAIERVTELESLGGQVLYRAVDVADVEALRDVVAFAENKWGKIVGVLHLAGFDFRAPIASLDIDDIERTFAAKINGIVALDKVFKQSDLELFAVFSSTDAATTEAETVHSVAVDAYINAYVQSCSRNLDRLTVSIGWGYWKETGCRAVRGRDLLQKRNQAQEQKGLSHNDRLFLFLLERGIETQEGVQAFERVLSGPSGVVMVSPVDLASYIAEIEKRSSKLTETDHIEPRDAIERVLAGFWKEIIGVRDVGIRDNFFDIGGHSLTAVRLFAKIKQEYGIQWPLSVLFEAPTIELCANLIREAVQAGALGEARFGGVKSRFLVKMHDGPDDHRKPIFIAAGAFGNVLNLRHLAQLLGHDRPVYGIQAKGLLGGEAPHETYEQAASDYLEEIRTVQPEGPYILAGFCSGGTIAYEMAQQLKSDGQRVSHLIMLDTISPDWREVMTRKDKLKYHFRNLANEGPDYFSRWAKDRVQWEWKLLRERFGLEKERTGPAVFRGEAIFAATLRAEDRYKPKPYPGPVALFRPRLDDYLYLDGGRVINRKREFVRPDNGWSPHIPHIDIQEIAADPGDHDGFVLEPAVRDLSVRIQRFVNAGRVGQ